MKRVCFVKIVKFISLALCLSLLFTVTGCSPSFSETSDPDDSSGPKLFRGDFGVGAMGSAWFIWASAIAEIVSRQHSDILLSVRTTGGSGENGRLLGRGDMAFGFVLAPDAGEAYAGTGPYDGEAKDFEKMRTVFAYPYAGIQVVTNDPTLNTYADLKGKKVGAGAPGSGGAVYINPIVLGAHGVTPENSSYQYLTVPEAASQLKDGHIDAMIIQQAAPIAQVMDLALVRDVKLLSITQEGLESILGTMPGAYPINLPPDLYGERTKNTEPVKTIGYSAMVCSHIDVPEEVVYRVMEALFDNLDTFYKSHVDANAVALEGVFNGATVPFHAGAVRFYQDRGLEVPPGLIPPELK